MTRVDFTLTRYGGLFEDSSAEGDDGFEALLGGGVLRTGVLSLLGADG